MLLIRFFFHILTCLPITATIISLKFIKDEFKFKSKKKKKNQWIFIKIGENILYIILKSLANFRQIH